VPPLTFCHPKAVKCDANRWLYQRLVHASVLCALYWPNPNAAVQYKFAAMHVALNCWLPVASESKQSK